jgi:hypothetical protein
MKIEEVRTEWLRLPLSQPIADASHVLRFLDLPPLEIRTSEYLWAGFGCCHILPKLALQLDKRFGCRSI